MQSQLDAYDRRILALLQEDASLSSAQIAERVGLSVKRLVSFKELNLIGDWPMKGKFDVIFCRNVVIYFDEPTQMRIWTRFADLLPVGGHLYIGHSENLGSGGEGFRLVGKTIYQSRDKLNKRAAA